jgi:chemotaxis protein methyltransferase CheR
MNLREEELVEFVNILKGISEYNFSGYSMKSLKRRVERILITYSLTPEQLIEKIRLNRQFLESVVMDITVNTTELFRDPKIWQYIRWRVIPKLQKNNKINIWVTGCSSGQEVYSLLIMMHAMELFDKVHLYATDLNSSMIDLAKNGVYKFRHNTDYLDNFEKVINQNPFNYEEKFEVDYNNYFEVDRVKDQIRMHDFLKRKPIIEKHDVVNGKPVSYTKFDIIFCRNVLIYFGNHLQTTVLNKLHGSLFKDGYLVLGMHESILGPMSSKFLKQNQVYKRIN